MRGIIAFFIFASTMASANEAHWENSILMKNAIFNKSPADSVFTSEQSVNSIQRIREPVAADRSKQAAELLDKIWLQLGLKKGGEQLVETDMPGEFGPKKQLPGRIYERIITQDKDRYIYCVGMFRTRNSMYAIYFKTYENVTGSCAKDLTSLSQSSVLYK